MKTFGVTSEEHDGRVHVRLSGEFDLDGAREVDDELQRALRAASKVVVLDLSGLSFVDSTGMRVILSASKRAERDGRRLVIVRGQETVQRIFEITRLDERLDMVDSADEV